METKVSGMSEIQMYALGMEIRGAIYTAKEHGVVLTEDEVTDDVRRHWRDVAHEDWRQKELVNAKELARERRRLAWLAAGTVIPARYKDVWPGQATAQDKRPAMIEKLRARVADKDARRAALEAAISIARGETNTVLLAGLTGAGKTTLAALMLRAVTYAWMGKWETGTVDPDDKRSLDGDPTFSKLLCANRKRQDFTGCFAWTTAREIVQMQKKNQSMDAIEKAPILVIDDLGGEPTQVNIGGVDDIIWTRHDAAKSLVTILTTGYCDPEAVDMDGFLAPLKARYSPALVRRVAEDDGSTRVIRVNMGVAS